MAGIALTPEAIALAGDDHAVPFAVEPLDVRGRAVQLGPLLDAVLGRHDYPEPVARLLAEAVVLVVLLGTSLKFEGKFTLQAQSDGPVDMLVADFWTPGHVRAYARFDSGRVADAITAGTADHSGLIGSGILALTIDQGDDMQRYQGIVQLDGTSFEEAARVYFRQSEQIPTEIRLAVATHFSPGAGRRWRAGGLLAQFLPDSPDRMRVPDLPGGDGDDAAEGFDPTDNAWREAQALVGTIEASELVDPTIGSERLLYRLFHEHGVRVFPGLPVQDDCTCSRERVGAIFKGFSAEEIALSTQHGKITVNCEFCSKKYVFDPEEFKPA